MKIALVTPGFSATDDDWCIPALQDLARQLAKRHDVHVFATTYPDLSADYEVKGISVSSFGDGRAGRLALTVRMWNTMTAIEACHRDRAFDLLHGFWADHGGVVTTLAARRMSVPNIVTVMAGELTYEPLIRYGKRKRPIAGRLGRYSARSADALIVNSANHASRINMEQPALQPTVVAFGVDTERFGPNGPEQPLDGDIPIVCAASLVPVKCHTILLEAFALVAAQVHGLHLHLIGKGRLESELRKKVDDLGLSQFVTIHGHVEHDLLPAFYRAARFCVLASSFESHGMVVLEAAACGRVTIGSDVGSMREFCPAKHLSPPGNAQALAATIEELARDSDLNSQLADDAIAKVNDAYTLDRSVNAFDDLYHEVVSRS